MDLHEIPGYKEAVEAEQSARSIVLLGMEHDICGVACRPFTVQDLINLQAIKSPFVCGGWISRMDCLRMLCIQSVTHRKPGPGWWERMALKRRNVAILRRVRSVGTEEMIAGINAFLDDAFLDAPASSGGASGSPIASSAATMVDAIASEYSWPISEILGLEVAFVFQLFRLRHVARGGNRAALINRRSSKVVGEYLRGLNSRMGAAQ